MDCYQYVTMLEDIFSGVRVASLNNTNDTHVSIPYYYPIDVLYMYHVYQTLIRAK